MAKKKILKTSPFDFTERNYILFGVAILVIIVGYIFLSKGPANSFWSLTLAPILLVIGYLILIPTSILWRDKKHTQTSTD